MRISFFNRFILFLSNSHFHPNNFINPHFFLMFILLIFFSCSFHLPIQILITAAALKINNKMHRCSSLMNAALLKKVSTMNWQCNGCGHVRLLSTLRTHSLPGNRVLILNKWNLKVIKNE